MTIVLQRCILQYIRLLYWKDASLNTLVLYWKDASQYVRLFCWKDASLNTLLEGCISQYIRVWYWKDASLNTLESGIGRMHLSQYIRVLYWKDLCISQYIITLVLRDAYLEHLGNVYCCFLLTTLYQWPVDIQICHSVILIQNCSKCNHTLSTLTKQ